MASSSSRRAWAFFSYSTESHFLLWSSGLIDLSGLSDILIWIFWNNGREFHFCTFTSQQCPHNFQVGIRHQRPASMPDYPVVLRKEHFYALNSWDNWQQWLALDFQDFDEFKTIKSFQCQLAWCEDIGSLVKPCLPRLAGRESEAAWPSPRNVATHFQASI